MSEPFEFKLDLPWESKRSAYRAHVPGLYAFIHEKERQYEVHDLSATGLAFFDGPEGFSVGKLLTIDLSMNGKVFVQGIPAVVVRVQDNGLTACLLEELDRWQEEKLDKLILEVQKLLIARRNARKDSAD